MRRHAKIEGAPSPAVGRDRDRAIAVLEFVVAVDEWNPHVAGEFMLDD
jgi:hypothetical protein